MIRNFRVLVFVFSAILGLSFSTLAALPAQAVETASISGNVRGAGGEFLPVQADSVPAYYGMVQALRQNSTGAFVQQDTDWISANGDYRLENLPAGTYRVLFQSASGTHFDQFWNKVEGADNADIIELGEGEQLADINAELRLAATISGKVTDADGERLPIDSYPYRGVVNAYRATDDNSYTLTRTEWIKEDGTYLLSYLPAGTYKIEFDAAESHQDEWWQDQPTLDLATPVELVAGDRLTGFDAKLALAPEPLTNTVLPKVQGKPVVGSTLQAKAGSWSQSEVSVEYQWFAGGVAIAGATKSSLKLKSAQLGKSITVGVTASKAGFGSSAQTLSAATTKVMAESSVAVKAKPGKNGKVKFAISVTSNKLPAPGKVTIYRGSKKLKTVNLNSKGAASVTLAKQPKGKQTYLIRYLGAGTAKAASKIVRVTVKK